MPKTKSKSRSKKAIFNKKDVKKRPIRVVYPYMCPLCDELSYPDSEKNFKPLRLPDETIYRYVCMAGHTFYVQERVVTHQDWAEDRCKNERMVKKSKFWKRQLRENQYGVEDLKE